MKTVDQILHQFSEEAEKKAAKEKEQKELAEKEAEEKEKKELAEKEEDEKRKDKEFSERFGRHFSEHTKGIDERMTKLEENCSKMLSAMEKISSK